jgi:peptidoglycan hydrolase-like protein with peptidoglycan-binding domain
MRQLLCKRNLGGLLLAALTAGTLTVPAVGAQSASSQQKKPVHKSPSGTSTTHTGTTHSKSSTANKSTRSTSSRSSNKKKSRKVKGQAAPTRERIGEIQEALAKKGVFAGTPSGKWDDSTVEAMKKFQASNGLDPTGKLDALTLQKLGLGSETAGLAPPTPPPNTANRLRNLSSLPPEPSN